MNNGNGWLWKSLVIVVVVGLSGYIWAQQDKKIDSTNDHIAAVERAQRKDHDTIADVKEDIATIKADQRSMKEDIGEIKDGLKEILKEVKKDTNP